MSSLTRGTVYLRPEERARHFEPLVELLHVRKVYALDEGSSHEALVDLSLSIAQGEYVAVTGPPGAGKSTLLSIVAGLERPTAGRVAVDGTDLASLSERRLDALRAGTIGVVHRAPFLLGAFTVLENLAMPMSLGGLARRVALERAGALLERFALGDIAARLPASLDVEEQQRVAVLRAVANDPRLLLADEPGSLLDPEAASRLFDFLDALRRNGLTILLATADPELARRAPRRIHLAEGRITIEEEAIE